MGKKKSNKEPETATATDTQDDIGSAPTSDIFKTLFGDVEAEAAASSVFSDSNPFKRKPEEPSQGGDGLVEEIKKKKRTQEERLNLDKASPVKEVENKGSADLGLEGKRKKKRKRDDVEKEYEERKYGAAAAEEEVKAAAVEVGKKRKKADNEVDLLVSKEGEGFDDESKLLRTVFVGNLPLKVKKKALLKEFSRFGEVESVRIRSVPIVDEAAKLVVRKRFLKIRDRELRLSHAKPDSTPSKRRNPFGADTEKTPTKKKAGDSRTPERSGGPIRKADMSYQGLRANKSAVKKKVNPTTPKRYGVAKPNGIKREGKRPAVAKRKEKTKAVKDGGAPMQGGKKRKLDSRSPGSSNRKKQAKRFR
ncbi:hypothetical protein Tsubulata_044477 [Turnera subulata]|uniref:RRM domain-containing protein n=1 Tax=Turnera subulata TaxID=218843 RepID=A0A9Q0J5A7_9ROSI|nr:hypothetical protein Tsubulata_044477 [Turnera subulata]